MYILLNDVTLFLVIFGAVAVLKQIIIELILVHVLERILRIHLNFLITYLQWHPKLTPNGANMWRCSGYTDFIFLLFKTQKIAHNCVAAGWYQTVRLSVSNSEVVKWGFRTQYCKTEGWYNLFVGVSVQRAPFRFISLRVEWLKSYLSWPHLNSNTSQTADHKHTSQKLYSFDTHNVLPWVTVTYWLR